MKDNEFKDICRLIQPYLEDLSVALNGYAPNDSFNIYISLDGYISLQAYGTRWRFQKLNSQANPEFLMEIREPVYTEKEVLDRKGEKSGT